MPDPTLHTEPAIDLIIRDLGRIPYAEAFELQKQLQREVIESREDTSGDTRKMYLLLVEHDPPVITISRRKGARQHLIATPEQLAKAGVEFCETDRGGDITYHGPGQLVAYPIIDLNVLGLRVHSYMRFLEQIVIDTLAEFGIEGQRDPEATGVWVGGSHEPCAMSHERGGEKVESGKLNVEISDSPSPHDSSKICAMGIRVSRWVSMHGLAINVDPDLSHYDLIVPCGLAGRSVTSMKRELEDTCPSLENVASVMSDTFRAGILSKIKPIA